MATLVIATRNQHKIAEIRAILGEEHEYLTLADLPGAPAVVEDAPTFAGNAGKKATELAAWLLKSKSPVINRQSVMVLADDSGLEVDALGGAPGVHSARFAALDSGVSGNSKDSDNTSKLLRLLANVPADSRTARFRCAIAIAAVRNDSTDRIEAGGWKLELFDGSCEGRIDFSPRGAGGFGYDPVFIPTGYDRTFAELTEAEKNRISHRSVALAKVKSWLNGQ